MLGIPTFKPNFFNDAELFLRTQSDEFEKLIGKTIGKSWIMWDVNENEWYPDGPVILEINGEHYEFCLYQLDDLSFTINSIDLNERLDWYGMGEEMPLNWKKNGKQELIDSLYLPILQVNLLTYNFISTNVKTEEAHETGFMLHGVEFLLEKEQNQITYFSIFNALDRNGLSSKRVEQRDQIKRIKIAGDIKEDKSQ